MAIAPVNLAALMQSKGQQGSPLLDSLGRGLAGLGQQQAQAELMKQAALPQITGRIAELDQQIAGMDQPVPNLGAITRGQLSPVTGNPDGEMQQSIEDNRFFLEREDKAREQAAKFAQPPQQQAQLDALTSERSQLQGLIDTTPQQATRQGKLYEMLGKYRTMAEQRKSQQDMDNAVELERRKLELTAPGLQNKAQAESEKRLAADRKEQRDIAKMERQEEQDRLDLEGDTRAQAQSWNKEFKRDTANFVEISKQRRVADDAYTKIKNIQVNGGDTAEVGAKDMDIVYAYAKVKDPRGRVTDADYRAPTELRPYFDLINKAKAKGFTGELLNNTQRAQIMDSIETEYRANAELANQSISEYRVKVDDSGLEAMKYEHVIPSRILSAVNDALGSAKPVDLSSDPSMDEMDNPGGGE